MGCAMPLYAARHSATRREDGSDVVPKRLPVVLGEFTLRPGAHDSSDLITALLPRGCRRCGLEVRRDPSTRPVRCIRASLPHDRENETRGGIVAVKVAVKPLVAE